LIRNRIGQIHRNSKEINKNQKVKAVVLCNSSSSKSGKMEHDYDLKTSNLYIEENRIPAYSLEKNEIGNCSNCDAILISLSYHSVGETIEVVTKCASCGAFYVNIYDSGWNWMGEAPVFLLPIPIPISNQIIDDHKGLERISMKKLEAVFSRGEIEALFAKAKNETPIRQYLYRARKKYELFEEIFDLRLEL
jgi:hypothetical protein